MSKITTLSQLKYYLCSDSHRYRPGHMLQNLMIPGFRYTFFMRLCSYFSKHNPLFYIAYVMLRHYKYKYGFEISHATEIGPGFYIGHFGCVVINAQAVIGRNVNLSHGVTIGSVNRGKKYGYPTIGNNVYIGPGAKIVGNIQIGNNAAIGANAVVTNDVPENCSVGGIPAKILSDIGAGSEYIQNPIEQNDLTNSGYPIWPDMGKMMGGVDY